MELHYIRAYTSCLGIQAEIKLPEAETKLPEAEIKLPPISERNPAPACLLPGQELNFSQKSGSCLPPA